MSSETKKNIVFYAIAFVVATLVSCLFGGCASQMYRTPCEHRVPMEQVNKAEGAVNYCPTCKKPYPYIPSSRYCDDDEIKWYDGFGWHWTGPYGRPYPYSYGYGYGGGGYGYRSYHHHAGCRCGDCYQ